MTKPIVSVLLPTHNRADVVGCAIASVLAQSFSSFELLIVGDGCDQATAAVVSSFEDSRIHWFDLPKAPGFGYANRNSVLHKARGDIIAYMTHDDLWFHDHLERCVAEFDDTLVEFVYSRPAWVDQQGLVFPITFNLHIPSVLNAFLSHTHNAIPSTTVLHRRSSFERVGYWNEQLDRNADWDMWTRIVRSKENCFRLHQEFTALHFHAVWKTESELPSHYFGWKEFYFGRDSDLPVELVLPMPGSVPVQHVFWHMLHEEPQNFSRRIREGLRAVMDLRLLEGSKGQAHSPEPTVDSRPAHDVEN